MSQIKSDNPLEDELMKTKSLASGLDMKLKKLTAGFRTMQPKERASAIKEIESTIVQIQGYLLRTSPGSFINAGAKFALENLKQSTDSIVARWRIFLKTIS